MSKNNDWEKSEADKIWESITTPEWRAITRACRQWASWKNMPPNMMNMLEHKVNEQVANVRQQVIDEVVERMNNLMPIARRLDQRSGYTLV